METPRPEDTARTLLRRFAEVAKQENARALALRALVMEKVPGFAAQLGAARCYLFGSVLWGGDSTRSKPTS